MTNRRTVSAIPEVDSSGMYVEIVTITDLPADVIVTVDLKSLGELEILENG